MSLFLKKEEKKYLLGIWQMEETWDELKAVLQNDALCSEAQRRFKSPQRQMEWLSARLLLKVLYPATPLHIHYLPSGKPVLANSNLHISISHTKGFVAVIIGPQDVGIDIEQYATRIHRLASKFIRTDETIVPYQEDNTWSLLLHWSAKEVLFKCIDATEVDFRTHLHILPFTPQAEGSFEAREYRTEQKQEFIIRYLLNEHFVLTYTY